MKIQVLGTGCPKCKKLEEMARKAADELNLDYSIEKVSRITDIMAMGVMSTPALAVDGKVLVAGRLPGEAELREMLSR
ncbi:MAG: thioredoxin family protein [Candidatus Fermentibacteraceae bacterium]